MMTRGYQAQNREAPWRAQPSLMQLRKIFCEGLSAEIEAVARKDAGCERLMSVPGIGPIISSATVAAIGTGDRVCEGARLRRLARTCATANLHGRSHDPGQDIEAWQLLPARFVRAGRVGRIDQTHSWERHGLKPWIEARKKRLHHNVLAIALANKLARIAWAVLATGRGFEMTRIGDAVVRPV